MPIALVDENKLQTTNNYPKAVLAARKQPTQAVAALATTNLMINDNESNKGNVSIKSKASAVAMIKQYKRPQSGKGSDCYSSITPPTLTLTSATATPATITYNNNNMVKRTTTPASASTVTETAAAPTAAIASKQSERLLVNKNMSP